MAIWFAPIVWTTGSDGGQFHAFIEAVPMEHRNGVQQTEWASRAQCVRAWCSRYTPVIEQSSREIRSKRWEGMETGPNLVP